MIEIETKKSAAQVVVAKKAAKLKAAAAKPKLSPKLATVNQAAIVAAGQAADAGQDQHNRKYVHGARAPPAVRLLDKAEVCALAGVTFPTIWAWMRAGLFPRSRMVGRGHSSKSVWVSTEIDAWLAALQVRPLKGDAPSSSETA